jgi:hypothetical protein
MASSFNLKHMRFGMLLIPAAAGAFQKRLQVGYGPHPRTAFAPSSRRSQRASLLEFANPGCADAQVLSRRASREKIGTSARQDRQQLFTNEVAKFLSDCFPDDERQKVLEGLTAWHVAAPRHQTKGDILVGLGTRPNGRQVRGGRLSGQRRSFAADRETEPH